MNLIKDCVVFSDIFEEGYYSKQGAIQEKTHVFLKGNSLEKRFDNLKNDFSIGELGFGLGLNFILTSQLFLNKNNNYNLEYFSIEKYPINIKNLQDLYRNLFPSIDISLLPQYDDSVNYQVINIDKNIKLHIFFLDVLDGIDKFPYNIDAWFLDGFSPKKNQSMWEENLLKKVYEKTRINGTFSTYSSAALVKNNLVNAGFNIKKIVGFGNKKEMLIGSKNNCL